MSKRCTLGPKFIATIVGIVVGGWNAHAFADYAAAVLADNPLGYWRFNEPDGDVAVNAGTAGAELNGEYIDAPRVAGPDEVDGNPVTGLGVGNLAISVGDELPSYVAVEASPLNDLDSEEGFTFEGWVNAGPRNQNRIGLWGQNDVPEFGFIQPFRIQLWTPGGGNVNWDFTEDDIEDDTWFHIAATSDIEETALYINGEFVQSGPGQPNPTFGNSGFNFNIGGGGVYDPPTANNGNQFEGLIDEVAIWTDRVLTEEEILVHYNAAFADTGDPCDFDGDGSLGIGDIDLLSAAIVEGNADAKFDVNGDGAVDPADVSFFATDESKLHTWIGDANGDGEFSSTDFVQVFQAGLFETGQPATWGQGDWNADGVFSSGDFVVAFQDGGFELGPKWTEGAASVPEPASLILLTIGGFAFFLRRRN